jgi:hypothetical protein
VVSAFALSRSSSTNDNTLTVRTHPTPWAQA